MKLLIITQKVDENDDHFTFFLDWIREFSKHYESVKVITLWKGSFNLPENVEVFSLGKEKKPSLFIYFYNYCKYLYRLHSSYDHVFVHMNPEYVAFWGWFWKLSGKKVALWYTHRHVDFKLFVATKFANVIFSASEKSFRLKTPKLHIVGHGINTEIFKDTASVIKDNNSGDIKIITVSRITKIKNLETFIKAIAVLSKKIDQKISAKIISKIPKEDDQYFIYLKKLVSNLGVGDVVSFSGAMAGKDLPKEYCSSDFSVNLTPSGGIDKAVLESMSCGVPCFSSNDALMSDFGVYSDLLMFKFGDHLDLAKKMEDIIKNKPEDIGVYLREQVVSRHDYKKLIANIVSKIK